MKQADKEGCLGTPGSDESLPLGRKSSSKFDLAVMLITEELCPRNSRSSIGLKSPYPSAALALRMLASS